MHSSYLPLYSRHHHRHHHRHHRQELHQHGFGARTDQAQIKTDAPVHLQPFQINPNLKPRQQRH